MGRPTRLEYTDGSSHKFWQVTTDGEAMTVTYGRIGSDGQSKTRSFASAAAASAEAAKLTDGKRKAGYAPAGKPAKATTKTASRKSAAGPQALIVTRSSDELVALWHDGKALFWAQIDAGEPAHEILEQGGTLAEAVAGEGAALERWQFASEAEARQAAQWAVKHLKKAKVRNDTSADIAAWTRRANKEARDCTPHLEQGPGPITLTRDVAHPYLYPRPPATSFLSKRTMVPVFSLVGPLDDRLGKHAGVFVNVCPQALLHPYFEHVWEVVVQDAAHRSAVDAYFETARGFSSVHLSQQIETISESVGWAVVQHDGEKTTAGWYRTTHFKSRAEAEKAFRELVAGKPADHKRVDKPGAYHTKILAEIARHNRVPGQRPATLKLRRCHQAMVQSVVGSSTSPGVRALGRGVVNLGGVPNFCQEDWDYAPHHVYSKRPLLCIASVGRGEGPQWSHVLNDGDAGTINIYAAPGDPFGAVSFSCC